MGTRTRVKVCGLRRREDVERCVELGVEMLGFNCWEGSPRYVAPLALTSLVRAARSQEVVLVFVRAEPDEVGAVLSAIDIPRDRLSIQLHGDEDPARYSSLGVRIVQVLRLARPGEPVRPVLTSRVLLDAHTPGFGGTGRRIDPETVLRLLPVLPEEWMLAGGLDAARVRELVERFRPWAVDVASGVEVSPGVKDHGKLAAFVASVRSERESETVTKPC